jgi:hypothetical protein
MITGALPISAQARAIDPPTQFYDIIAHDKSGKGSYRGFLGGDDPLYGPGRRKRATKTPVKN